MQQRLFHRSVIFSNVPIRGHFVIPGEFQLFFDDSLSRPDAYYAHHPLVLEHYYELPADLFEKAKKGTATMSEREIIGHFQNVRFNSILNLLSVFTTYRFLTYDKKNKNQSHSWFTSLSYEKNSRQFEPNYMTVWGSKFYNDLPKSDCEVFSDLADVPIALITRELMSHQGVHESPSFPDDIKTLLKHHSNLNKSARESFDNCSTLYTNGIELFEISYSLAFIAFVSCIETLIYHTHKNVKTENCPSCGQLKYKVTKRFIDFLNKYGSPDSDYKKTANTFYQMRSKIAHQGELMTGDVIFAMTQSHLDQMEILRELKLITGICVRNWLMAQPAENDADKETLY